MPDYESRNKDLLKDREQGFTLKEIAVRYGITFSRVSQIINKAKKELEIQNETLDNKG